MVVGVVLTGSGGGDASDGFVTALNDRPGETAFTLNVQQPLPPGSPGAERVILRSAHLSLIVDEPDAHLATINRLADDTGGWVVSSTTNSGTLWTVNVEIRIPADQFDAIIDSIKNDVIEVEAEVIRGQDVTQEYTDLNSQLTNLEAAETQLQSFMETAEDTQAVLSVYNELVRIRGEIETIQGRINYYEQWANFAQITVELRAEVVEEPNSDDGWNPGDTVETAAALLVNLARLLVDVLIFVVIVGAPMAIVIGIPLGLFYRFTDRRRRAAAIDDANDEE
jgi:hypothetical protein